MFRSGEVSRGMIFIFTKSRKLKQNFILENSKKNLEKKYLHNITRESNRVEPGVFFFLFLLFFNEVEKQWLHICCVNTSGQIVVCENSFINNIAFICIFKKNIEKCCFFFPLFSFFLVIEDLDQFHYKHLYNKGTIFVLRKRIINIRPINKRNICLFQIYHE